MKLENGHHITIADATDEQYHKFCKKVRDQGFDEGEHGWGGWRDWLQVGILDGEIQHFDEVYSKRHPDKLLTIEQALSEQEETMTKCRIIEIEEKPTFKPFKLEVLVESEDDLINLWHRVSAPSSVFVDYVHDTDIKEIINVDSSVDDDIYILLDGKAEELGLK